MAPQRLEHHLQVPPGDSDNANHAGLSRSVAHLLRVLQLVRCDLGPMGSEAAARRVRQVVKGIGRLLLFTLFLE